MEHEFKNGDEVTYERCFGDKKLVFVGRTKLLYTNDCVLADGEKCFPATIDGVKKVCHT